MRFEYAYVGLPALDAKEYLTGEQILGVALSTLMKVPPERRAELYAEGLQRIATSGENDYRQHLLAECLDAYSDMTDDEKRELEELLEKEDHEEGKILMTTTFERGILTGERNSLLRLLEMRFGSVPPRVRLLIEQMDLDQVQRVFSDCLQAQSLDELDLESTNPTDAEEKP